MRSYEVEQGTSVYVRERRRGAEWERRETNKPRRFTWDDVVYRSDSTTIFAIKGYVMQVENALMVQTAMD